MKTKFYSDDLLFDIKIRYDEGCPILALIQINLNPLIINTYTIILMIQKLDIKNIE
jgi:hypothetical protein